jgi:sn-glycerol 3-phosphate transport system substrate-binding protein
MKRITHLLVTLLLLGAVVFATGAKENQTASQPEANLPTVTGPVTITLWHTRGAGANGDQMAASVKEFNETNTLGITVQSVYQGDYAVTLAKTLQAIAAGTNPTMVILERASGVPVLADEGLLFDMLPLAKRDGMDLDNFFPAFMNFCLHDGKLISLPFVRSTPVLYYNKGMFDAAGITQPPKTIAQLEADGKKLTKVVDGKTEVYGFEMLNNPAWDIQNMTYQLGSNMLSDDGLSAPNIYDGTLLKVITAWRQWVDDGWCLAPVVTSPSSAMKEAFMQGKLASFSESTGSMINILSNAQKAGIDVQVVPLPTWDEKIPSSPVGGANLAILAINTTDNQKAAAWEFMKFLMSDEQVAENSINSGYLPVTKTAKNLTILQDHWAKYPQAKVAYDQLPYSQDLPWSPYLSEYKAHMAAVFSKLIQDRSITAEEAIAEIQAQAEQIFHQKE